MSGRGPVFLQAFVSDPNGKPAVKLRGYAAVFSYKSAYLRDGLPEVLVPGCFDSFLKTGRQPNLTYAHLGADGFMTRNLRLWSDSYGLAFEAEEIRMTELNAKVIHDI